MDNSAGNRQAVYILCSDQDTTIIETAIVRPDGSAATAPGPEAIDREKEGGVLVKQLPAVHWAHVLPSGETILERQLRIFASCGVRDFVLCMENPPAELLEPLRRLLPPDCRIRVIGAEQSAQALRADFEGDAALSEAIVLDDRVLFDRIFAQSFLDAAGPGAALNKSHDGELKARIDFKRVLEIAKELEGVNCFEFLHILKLDRRCAELLADETELKAGILHHVSEMALNPTFATDGVARCAAAGEDIDELYGSLSSSDFEIQKTVSGAGSISQIAGLLRAFSISRPLFVCDSPNGESQVKDLLALYGIPYAAYYVGFSDVTQESISAGLEILEREKCDAVLAVGGSSCLQIARLMRFFHAIGAAPNEELTDMRVSRRCPFVAVPLNKEDKALGGSARYRLPFGWRSFRNPLLMPELLISDSALMNQAKKTAGGPGWVSKLAGFLWKNAVKKPLLIYDAVYASSPAKDVLSFYAIPHANLSVEGLQATPESISLALETLEREECDAILAVGGNDCVQIARIMRFYYAIGKSPKDELTEIEILRGCPLAVIPLNRKAPTLSRSASISLPVGSRSISHDLLVPDLILRPKAFFAPAASAKVAPARKKAVGKRSIKRVVTAFKKSSGKGAKTRLINTAKAFLRPYPEARKWAKSNYKALLFSWYKRRYLVGNQNVLLESYQGNNITCNPLGLYTAMRSCPEYTGFTYTWAVKNPARYKSLKALPDTKVVQFESKEHLQAIARSRFIISNVRMLDYIRLWPEQVYIQTWHGKPIKRIGQDVNYTTAGGRGSAENHRIFTNDAKKITYLLSPSPAFTEHMSSAYNLKALGRENIIRETGYPRNDFLFQYTDKDVLRVKLALGIPLDKKVVLYAPTWRPTAYEKGTGYLYHQTVDFEALHEALGDGYVVMFRAHINEAKSIDFSALAGFVMDMTKVEQVNDLLIVSDILISDYSGIIFDYANLRRPIILYQYDREEYVNDLTGVYIDLDELPGQLVRDSKDLPEAIRDGIKNFTYDEKYARFNEKYNGLDGADCGLRTALELIPPDTLKTPEQVKREENWIHIRNMRCRMTGFLRKTGLKLTPNDKLLLAFKDKHKGERCFLIGNGPSLRLEDLEAIRGEYSFCCNGIYRIFDRTNWRPTYYFFTDNVFTSQLPAIRKSFSGTFFTNNLLRAACKDSGRVVYVNTVTRDDYYIHGNMLDYYVSSRATVMSFMIEMAMFMGFKEIYLLGVDCSNGFVGQDSHFINGYMSKQMEVIEQRRTRNVAKNGKRLSFEELGRYRIDRSMIAYEKLEKYSSEHGVKIFNATRGGYLEAFERIDLDSMTLKEAQTTEPVPTE